MTSPLPKWIKKLTVKTGPCKMCGPKCNDADKLYEALTIAMEAMNQSLKWNAMDELSSKAIRHEIGMDLGNALRRIRGLGDTK